MSWLKSRKRSSAAINGKSRRVPITPKLAAAIKRFEARHRDHARVSTILVNDRGLSYTPWGIDQLMDRLEKRVGFHIHAHCFRHTFATIACQAGWNLERLRAAMGHADYAILHRYVRLSSFRRRCREAAHIRNSSSHLPNAGDVT